MKELYNEGIYLSEQNKARKALIASLICLGLALASFFLSAFLMNYENGTLMKILVTVISSLFLFAFVYFLFDQYLPVQMHHSHLNKIMTSSRFQGMIHIESISKPYLLKKGVMAKEITGKTEEGKAVTYYLEDGFDFPFAENESALVIVSQHFITAYEEENK